MRDEIKIITTSLSIKFPLGECKSTKVSNEGSINLYRFLIPHTVIDLPILQDGKGLYILIEINVNTNKVVVEVYNKQADIDDIDTIDNYLSEAYLVSRTVLDFVRIEGVSKIS